MTTVTTEAISGVADLKAGYTLGNADVMILKALAAELLAVREAQSVPIGCIKTICGNKTLKWWRDAPEGAEVFTAPPAPAVPAGFKLMPIEITDQIGEAIAMEANCCGGIALDIYNSALAAAPTPTK